MRKTDVDGSSRIRSSRSRPIFRVRTGCLRCRVRKKKCDEIKPICRACERNKFQCEWPSKAAHPISGLLPRPEPPRSVVNEEVYLDLATASIDGQETRQNQGSDRINEVGSDGMELDDRMSAGELADQQNTMSLSFGTLLPLAVSPSSSSSTSPSNYGSFRRQSSTISLVSAMPYPQSLPCNDDSSLAEVDEQYASSITTIPAGDVSISTWNTGGDVVDSSQSLLLPRNMALMPEYGSDAYQLLSHYLTKTAESMSNGFSPSNPFLSQLIPLAFSSDVILRLILSQSAAHRAVLHQGQTDVVASGHYSTSLKLFRQRINSHIGGTKVEPLILAVGALIMCFTETAKGDINGVIFDHLSASTSLLLEALRQNPSTIPTELKDFLVEYYSYTATLSLISIDTNVSSQSLLNPELEELAHQMVLSQYVGSLCGCWLELLLFIPKVFNLGRQWRLSNQSDGEESTFTISGNQLSENLASFALLQFKILQWSPHSSNTTDGTVAGRIFQQALLLYLYTSLQSTGPATSPNYESLIEATVAESMSLFDQLSSTVRINTSLCWPIAVIGSCLKNDIWRQKLRNRLNTMLSTIGLGNIRQTLRVLEYVWKRPLDAVGPWSICKVMQDHQIWISFA